MDSPYTDKGNPHEVVSKRYLKAAHYRFLRKPNYLEKWLEKEKQRRNT